jgi:hypothetical protein
MAQDAGVGPRLVALALVAAFVAACAASSGPASSAPSTIPSSPQPSAVGHVLSAAADGLSMTVELDRWEVAPGGTVQARVRVRNDRARPVADPDGCLLAPRWTVDVLMPFEPAGRTWKGIAGKFKDFAMHEGMQPGIVSSRRPIMTTPAEDPCATAPASLEPGATAEWTLTWKAQMMPGIEAPAGSDPFRIIVNYSPEPKPGATPAPSRARGAPCCFFASISVAGTLNVVGKGPHLLSAGQAIDALLADRRFATWLPKMPATTWSGTNVFLQNSAKEVGLPFDGPTWEIDLFREVHVKRNWAIGSIDAQTGKVRSLIFCNIPCDR